MGAQEDVMGLSENEQRILDELESQLRSEDPGLERRATKIVRAAGGVRDITRSVVIFVVGFALLLGLTFNPLYAIAGAALMLVAIVQGARAVSLYAKDQVNQAKAKASRTDDAR